MNHPWEMERQLLEEGVPRILSEEEQTWDAMAKMESDENARIKLFWESHVPGSYALEKIGYGAAQSMENMGYDITGIMDLLKQGDKEFSQNQISDLCRTTAKILIQLNNLPVDKTHPYHSYKKYETFENYLKDVNFEKYTPLPYETDELYNKNLGGWQGQIIGGAIGTALEGYTYEQIYKTFGDIKDYVRKPNTLNDDITFELAFLDAFEKSGINVTSEDIALEWQAQIPWGWSAEDIALRNIRLGIQPPLSGYLHNPYREWIGAQMRGAMCGMVAPGNPKLAAELAFKDGSVSHHNNGVIAEVFNAIIVSMAYTNNNIQDILEQSVALTPEKSEYGTVVRFALDACKNSQNWLEAWKKCDEKYIKYNWVHAYPNACAEVVALWFGNGDFVETLHIIAMEGVDVDCNAAQILTAIGIIIGSENIPEYLISPIGDRLDTYLRDYKEVSIKALARRTTNLSIISTND